MAIKKLDYYNNNKTNISTHTKLYEFASKNGAILYSRDVYYSEELLSTVEHLFNRLRASKYVISSGYRTSTHDKAVGGNGYGQHTLGRAVDCVFYDKSNNKIPSNIVCCVAQDIGFKGIARINAYYVHLDNRESGTYKGDETISNKTVTTDFYDYFSLTSQDIAKYTGGFVNTKSAQEIAKEVLQGKWGNGQARKTALIKAGYDYPTIQNEVSKLLNNTTSTKSGTLEQVAREVIQGRWGSGQARKTALIKAGYNPTEVQQYVNKLLKK